jgi:adenosylcobinamide kinase / adenosylcobinamide-phosphate guanylyltransferase
MITLITGGARAGKSTLAENLASKRSADVTYIATAECTDDEMIARIAAHRAQRPGSWATVEPETDLAGALRAAKGLALVECLGTWLARHHDFAADIDELLAALRSRTAPTIVVTNEVGMGVHPYTDVGRAFRDALGSLNRRVADIADEVLLVVAGRVLSLPPSPS